MLLIKCPWCGERAEIEFSCGGEADIVRPVEGEKLSDREWGDYVFIRPNTLGVHRERWHDSKSCRRWLMVEPNTLTYELGSYAKFTALHAGDDKCASPDVPTRLVDSNRGRALMMEGE